MSALYRINQINSRVLKMISRKGEALKKASLRVPLIMTAFVFLFTVVAIRVCDVSLSEQGGGHSNAYVAVSIKGKPDIVDRNGMLLATTLDVDSLYADPVHIEDPKTTAYELKKIFPDLNLKTTYSRLASKQRFAWISRRVTPAQKTAVMALGIPGLDFKSEPSRFYPQQNLFAHTVGYSGLDQRGLSGIERAIDQLDLDASDAVQVSLDSRVQFSVREALVDTVERFNAKGAVSVVVDLKTGEILSSVSYPDFDPHKIDLKNPAMFDQAMQGVFELGSVMKIFSTASYLDHDRKSMLRKFDASAPLRRGGFNIHDYHPLNRVMTVPEIFMHSSNIGTVLMTEMLGVENLQERYRSFGFFDPVVIDSMQTASPIYPKQWRSINALTASYGHGIALTPYHLMQAMTVFANEGAQQNLTFLKQSGSTSRVQSQILSKDTVQKMQLLMRLSTLDGTGKKADVTGLNVGGKTGTAEKAVKGGYNKDRLLSSYVAAFPSNDPHYAVFVMVNEPQGIKETYGYATGGWVAAPAAARIMASMKTLYGIGDADSQYDLRVAGDLGGFLEPETRKSLFVHASY